MVQRGLINLGQGVFRISQPGVDVKTALPNQLLLDERVLYPQLLASIYVPRDPNPVVVNFPSFGFVPRPFLFTKYNIDTENRMFPTRALYIPDNTTQNHYFAQIEADKITVAFPYPTSILGAQIILMRP